MSHSSTTATDRATRVRNRIAALEAHLLPRTTPVSPQPASTSPPSQPSHPEPLASTIQLALATTSTSTPSKQSANSKATGAMAEQKRPPITCHILDTTSGRPASNVHVVLEPSSASSFFEGTTNADGRVTAWKGISGEQTLEQVFQSGSEPIRWQLTFGTGSYYEGKGITPFFPEVTIKIVTRNNGEHYHVPLLLGPYSYTTYRGS